MPTPLGSISSGTMRPEDLLPAFADKLRALDTEGAHAELLAECDAYSLDEDGGLTGNDIADILVEELFDALGEYAPPYAYFGAHPGDGADYGFWLNEDFEQMMRDDDVLMVADLAEVPANLALDALVCVVNDHGNATLYRAGLPYSNGYENGQPTLHEIWSVV